MAKTNVSKTVTEKTLSPTGLSIARDSNKYTFSWKIKDKDHGAGQQLQYRVKAGGSWSSWSPLGNANTSDIGKTTTSKAQKLTMSNYYPASGKPVLEQVEFRVRGKRKSYQTTKDTKTEHITYTHNCKWSDWEKQSFVLKTEAITSVSGTWGGADYPTRMTFAWAATAKEKKPIADIEWQSMRVKNSSVTKGENLSWSNSAAGYSTGTSSTLSSSQVVNDDSAVVLANETDSWTRWFRARTRCPNGPKTWGDAKYASHVYAYPYQAKIDTAGTKAVDKGTAGFLVTAKWNANSCTQHPVDSSVIQYAIATPSTSSMTYTGSGWSDAATSSDTSGNASTMFMVGDTLDVDECLFVRVNNKHDELTKNGASFCVYKGRLSTPEIDTVSVSGTNVTVALDDYGYTVPGSYVVIVGRTASAPNKIERLGTIASSSQSATVSIARFGSASVQIGVFAETPVVGGSRMTSPIDWDTGTLPTAPTISSLVPSDIEGTAHVEWTSSWTSATGTQLAWADHPDAWESTDEPSTYDINIPTQRSWNISGLETDAIWYVRVRMFSEDDNGTTYSPWSEVKEVDLASTPLPPTLTVSAGIIRPDESVTVSWEYENADGSTQYHADVYQATISQAGVVTPTRLVGIAGAAHSVTIKAKDPKVAWTAGNTYNLIAKVYAPRQGSAWSDPVSVTVANPPSITVGYANTSLEEETLYTTDEEGQTTSRTVYSLTDMPLTATVTGAGTSGTTRLAVKRADDYSEVRPNEDVYRGYEDEIVVAVEQTGEAQITITNDDVRGMFNDTAKYKIVATIEDEFGQSAEAELPFEVHWEEQAEAPTATIVVDSTNLIAKLTPVAPTNANTDNNDVITDVCDIYRLSADKPVLIYEGAEFGTMYVDPFPTIGTHGGYRFVTRTENNDYTTAEVEDESGVGFAWTDYSAYLDMEYCVINFGTGLVFAKYNIDLSNSWEKDFRETKYLGGAVQGDWNPAVSRTGSVSNVVIETSDPDVIEQMRRLAVYPGICHIRTPDGSSFAGDVQVSEDRSHNETGYIVNYSLSFTRVDPEGLDGLTFTDWETQVS